MPVQDQEFPVGSMATVPGWGAVNNTGVVPLFPTDLMFNDRMEIVGDGECAQMYEGWEKDLSLPICFFTDGGRNLLVDARSKS